MDFTSLPPEVSSALIHSGPGAESLVEASGAWQRLGADLEDAARSCGQVLSALSETWRGPSSSAMIQAASPYLTWLLGTAQQCQQLAVSAQAAVAAFGSTLSAVVHPAVVSANRIQLAQLLATNGFGRNLTEIAETETQYQHMWINNSAAMYRYQAASAQALSLSQFSSPPSVVKAAQAAAVPSAAAPADLVDNGWFQLANTYANQFISSGFPINLLSYLAQNTSAQALQAVAPEIGQGLSEGESALGASALGTASLSGAVRALGSTEAPTAAVGGGVSLGRLTAPPAAAGLLAPAQTPVQLASAV
ncbi:hypothetical protein A5791_15065, partial [Mycobacterium sp. 852002-51163_SCH5372311]|uniref:PPE family protein n=1 Tax=Mycobacterium sp. 852002-51163_SCH5372311 TaxID=1834097 RepID=UPI0007FBBC89